MGWGRASQKALIDGSFAGRLSLKVEGNSELFELGFLFAEPVVAELVESAFFSVGGEERVDFFAKILLTLCETNGPTFFLERGENCLGGLRIFLPIFESGHLVVDEGFCLALNDFKHAGIFVFKDKWAGIFEGTHGIEVAGGSLFYGNALSLLIGIGDRGDFGCLGDEQAETRAEIGFGEINGLGALWGGGHGGDDEVNFSRLECGN